MEPYIYSLGEGALGVFTLSMESACDSTKYQKKEVYDKNAFLKYRFRDCDTGETPGNSILSVVTVGSKYQEKYSQTWTIASIHCETKSCFEHLSLEMYILNCEIFFLPLMAKRFSATKFNK